MSIIQRRQTVVVFESPSEGTFFKVCYNYDFYANTEKCI